MKDKQDEIEICKTCKLFKTSKILIEICKTYLTMFKDWIIESNRYIAGWAA
ncbi:unnamed protein product [Arabidopsis halleri]